MIISKVSICLFLLFILKPSQGHGSFKTYNLEGRTAYENSEVNRDLNEVEGSDQWNKVSPSTLGKYQPTWPSIDSRPLPKWFDESKVGIFIHWGVFSVLGRGAWFWNCWKEGTQWCVDFMKNNYKPGFTYQELGPDFTATFFNPEDWADIFKKSGARYVVLTSKHHEGYTLWPSKTGFSWNSMDVGPKRDLVGDLAKAIRNRTSLHFGLYHSLFEFYNPLYLNDKKNLWKTDEFVRFKAMPELYELVNNYKPDVIWSDGDWEAPDYYWQSQEFIAWLYNESPVKDTVVTNDRWGKGVSCKHGGFFSCADKFNPGVLQPHKWENCFTLDKYAWGHRKDAKIEDFLTPDELITTIVESIACGGNVLVNVGPTPDGMIIPIQQERLLQMGKWLEINGEAIYESVPWTAQNDTITPDVWYTTNPHTSRVYAMITKWPNNCEEVHLGSVNGDRVAQATMLGYNGTLSFVNLGPTFGIRVALPSLNEIKSKWAWTIVLQYL